MPYPRELHLGEEIENRLIRYIETELLNHHAERSDYVDELKKWQADYWATPSTKNVDFPFKGAATIIIPLSGIAIEAIHARVMTTMFGLPQFVSAQAMAPDWEIVEKPVERFLDYELQNVIKIRQPLGDCYLEAEKYGTMVAEVGYERIVKTAVREINGIEQEFPVVVKDGAVVDSVPGARFLMPFHEKDPEMAIWVGTEHSASWYHLETMELAGLFRPGTIISRNFDADGNPQNPSKLYSWLKTQSAEGTAFTSGIEFDRSQQTLDKTKPVFPKQLDWKKLKLAFDVDNSSTAKEIIVHYHQESRTIMSIRYNWNEDLGRDYLIGQYFPVEHRWRGIGICKMNEQFQREITTQHRQRIDNATIANMRMIVVSKMSNYGPNEPIFPGKMWLVDDLAHINTLQLGEVYASAFENEQATLIYWQQRLGVNETILGMPQSGTPGTATSDLARIQEGNKKFDFVFQNFKDFASQIINRVAVVIQQFGPRRLAYYDTVEGGQLVKQYFSMPESLVRDGLLISLKAAGAQQNKILDRQNWTQISQFMQQYFTNALSMMQFIGDPQLLMLVIAKAILASNEAMRQIFETYDVRNIDRMLLTEIEQMLRSTFNGQAPGQGSGQPVQTSGSDIIAQVFGAGASNGTNRIGELQQRV